jgi:hypothetical protein
MSEAVDVLHAMARLVALANARPGADAAALGEVDAVLFRMGLGNGAGGYKAEKLAVVRDGFAKWLSARQWADDGGDSKAFGSQLLRDLEHLRKALARGSEGQD